MSSPDLNYFIVNIVPFFLLAVDEIENRMSSLRNLYQRLHRKVASGAEPEGRTERQKEVLRLLWFLRNHIKTSASLNSYKRPTPVKAESASAKRAVDTQVELNSEVKKRLAEFKIQHCYRNTGSV